MKYVFKVKHWEKVNCQVEIRYAAKLSFKHEGNIMTFSFSLKRIDFLQTLKDPKIMNTLCKRRIIEKKQHIRNINNHEIREIFQN
jgi:DNA topoisomerase VI subunit A